MMQKSLLLALLFAISAGQDEKAYTEVQQKLQALSEAVQVLCGSSTPPPIATVEQQCDCSHAVNWTSVPSHAVNWTSHVTNTQPDHNGTQANAYVYSNVSPVSAKEVLVSAAVLVGTIDSVFCY